MSSRSVPRVRDRIVHPPSAPQRILFLINDLRIGGAERSLANFVNHLRSIRPAVVLIEATAELLGELNPDLELFSLDRRAPGPLPAAERQAAIPDRGRRDQPRGRMLLELPGLLRKALRLARLARATDAQVVSTFLNRSHTIALLSKFLFAPRLQVVINVHEMLSDHLDRYFSAAERPLMRAFITHAFPRAKQIVAVSGGVRDDLVRRFSIPVERITVVPNPIDLSRIRRASEENVDDVGRRQECVLIVAVGRLVQLKGFDVLIRAFANLPKRLHAKLLIIGEGEERPALERLTAELKVADRVELMGTKVNPWKYMARATVIALPSRTEAFPNVIGEALALSVPVVAARCSEGVTEYLDGGRCGLLVPPDDAPALAEALERILTDADLRRQLAHEGASRVEAFDLPHVVRRYEKLIEEAGHR